MTIPAAHAWKTNGDLIADVAKLGYLDGLVLDPTYGRGGWWKRWTPDDLTASDINAEPANGRRWGDGWWIWGHDFTRLPAEWADGFDAVAFDPPYKLNGTPTPEVDDRYGVGTPATWQDRHCLILDGMNECVRVLKPGGYLLLKCQDQVCSGAVRWQTDEFSFEAVDTFDLIKVDRFDMLGTARPQPSGRRQVHAHGRPSTLLVFRKPR